MMLAISSWLKPQAPLVARPLVPRHTQLPRSWTALGWQPWTLPTKVTSSSALVVVVCCVSNGTRRGGGQLQMRMVRLGG